ncbi:ComEC/Rec2 family competence protein [Pedobacter sp. GSP4]|uniref:ComEC/Rec2 family competence protein n=1 Tax=Pedobacter sp. GSP4 TaxID=3453716 RepID=UPI003EEECF3F
MFKAEYVFVRILFPFLTGIGLAYFFPSTGCRQLVGSILILTVLLVILINISYKKFNLYRYKGCTGALLIFLFFNFGAFICLLNFENINQSYFCNSQYTHLKVSINDEPQQTHKILRFKAKVISGYKKQLQFKSSGQLLISLVLDSLNPIKLKYGDELIIPAQYNEIEPPYNPGEFNFKSWLSNQNIYQQAFTDQQHIIATHTNNGNWLVKQALLQREKQVKKFRKLIKNDEAFAVAATLILGYRADLSTETLSAYADTGTLHALSVSGAHVAIVYVVLDFLFIFLNRRLRLKVIKLVLICTLVWGYALITGLSPSVVRAVIMISVFIIAKTLSKNTNNYNILAFSAFCQLIYNPFMIWDVGFQLSYLAVFGLIYLQPKIYNLLYMEHKWLDKLWNFIAMSLAAQVVTFPLSIYYFHQFPLYFLLANLFISIPLILMMYLGIAVLFPPFYFLASIFEWVINFTNAVLKWIAHLPYATFSAIWINLPEFILLSLALATCIYGLANWSKRFIFSSILLFIVYQIFVLCDDLSAHHQRRIIFFSLRKNYATAFIDGKEAILVTDLNVTDKSYGFFIKPALMQMQIDKTHIIALRNDTLIGNFIQKDHQIVFCGYNIFLIDSSLNYKRLKGKGDFETIWITGHTRFDLNHIQPTIKYKTVLIDATNKAYKTKILKETAHNNGKAVYVLKKNKAYLVQLSP